MGMNPPISPSSKGAMASHKNGVPQGASGEGEWFKGEVKQKESNPIHNTTTSADRVVAPDIKRLPDQTSKSTELDFSLGSNDKIWTNWNLPIDLVYERVRSKWYTIFNIALILNLCNAHGGFSFNEEALKQLFEWNGQDVEEASQFDHSFAAFGVEVFSALAATALACAFLMGNNAFVSRGWLNLSLFLSCCLIFWTIWVSFKYTELSDLAYNITNYLLIVPQLIPISMALCCGFKGYFVARGRATRNHLKSFFRKDHKMEEIPQTYLFGTCCKWWTEGYTNVPGEVPSHPHNQDFQEDRFLQLHHIEEKDYTWQEKLRKKLFDIVAPTADALYAVPTFVLLAVIVSIAFAFPLILSYFITSQESDRAIFSFDQRDKLLDRHNTLSVINNIITQGQNLLEGGPCTLAIDLMGSSSYFCTYYTDIRFSPDSTDCTIRTTDKIKIPITDTELSLGEMGDMVCVGANAYVCGDESSGDESGRREEEDEEVCDPCVRLRSYYKDFHEVVDYVERIIQGWVDCYDTAYWAAALTRAGGAICLVLIFLRSFCRIMMRIRKGTQAGHDPSFDEHHLLEARFAAQFFGMATSQITLAPIVPAFLIYIVIVLSKGPVISDLMSQYWPFLLALIFIAAVEWTFAKTFLNNAACRGLTITNPMLFAIIFLPASFLFYIVGALYFFMRMGFLLGLSFMALFQFEYTIFNKDWCSWDICYRGMNTTAMLLNNVQNPVLQAVTTTWLTDVRKIQDMNAKEKSKHMKRQQIQNRLWLWVMLSKDEQRDGTVEGMGMPTLKAQRSHNLVKDEHSHHEENPNATFWFKEQPSWLSDSCWPQGCKEEPGSGRTQQVMQQVELNRLSAKKDQIEQCNKTVSV